VKNLLPAEAGELHFELVLKVCPKRAGQVIHLVRIGAAEPDKVLDVNARC
jgi:hypothetical protein